LRFFALQRPARAANEFECMREGSSCDPNRAIRRAGVLKVGVAPRRSQ
jgi:hypothetical protein